MKEYENYEDFLKDCFLSYIQYPVIIKHKEEIIKVNDAVDAIMKFTKLNGG